MKGYLEGFLANFLKLRLRIFHFIKINYEICSVKFLDYLNTNYFASFATSSLYVQYVVHMVMCYQLFDLRVSLDNNQILV